MSDLPWDRIELRDWSIVGMNHYVVGGWRHLFVAMTDVCGRCIKEEGRNEREVFERLARQAWALQSPPPQEAER